MKNLIYILSVMIISTLTYAQTVDESKIDIYFGNGVWNKQFSTDGCKKDSAADCSKEILNLLIQKEIIAKGDPSEVKKYSDVKLQYNWGQGHLNDVLETYYQLREAKQINNLEFFLLMSKLTYGVPVVSQTVTAALMASLPAIAEIEQDNVDEMLTNYYLESFQWSHRVLLVSHSQGNMFANRIYDSLKDSEYYKGYEKYFTNVQVGSPASGISTPEGKYITNIGDLVINPIPGSMTANANPDPENRVSSECLSALLSFESIGIYNNCLNEQDNHKFVPFYLGQSDPLSQIIPAIRYQLESLNQRGTQWKIKEEGCICKDKYVTVTHEFDDEANLLMDSKKVKDFSSVSGGEGKIYPVGEQYVKASAGGVNIETVEESETCFVLKDDNEVKLGEIRGINVTPVTTHAGALKMTLSWTYQCDIDMDLTMTGNDAVVYDIKDVEDAGKEHLYIPSLFDINPGDHYVFNANGKQLPDSELTEEMLAEDPIEVRALLETTKGAYFNVWPVESFASLDLGDFAEVNVYESIQAEWICPAISNVSGWYRPYNSDTESFQCLYCPVPYSVEWREPSYNYQKGSWYCKRPYRPRVYSGGGGGSGGRTYSSCSEEEKKSSCGCVPCDYIVSGMKKRIENGPIAGAKVEIIKASAADAINPTVLYRGSTTDKEDIFQSGLLEIPDATLDTFEDNEYYLVLAEGGKDIDRNDDMVRDTIPTENNGTIHALLKGSDLKRLPFRVNILTEAIYQVSGDSIGLNYNALALQTKLDTTAQKLINHKLYPGDDDNRINYKDVLLWTPAVDKKALYKPFTTYVEPIIESLYADKERFDESYRLIYEPYESNAPQLEPLALEIPEGLDNNTIIAQIKTHNKKVFTGIVLQGNFSDHFSVDDEGYIHIAQSSLIEESNRYRLQMKAVDAVGREGSFVSLLIEVKGQIVQADPTTSKPRFVSVETFDTLENAPEGTVVANTHFEDSNQTIVSYTLSGEDSSHFSVDDQGVVSVGVDADIDYEKSKVYRFGISAMNDVENVSYPIIISIPIMNQLDTPLFDLVVFEHIEENIPKGSVITTIRADREGLEAIEKFEILSPNMPFTIDNNGTLIVSNYIDYEQVKQYDFYAIARTKYGNSNKIEIHIVVDNQSPEIGVPTLEDLTITVDENVASSSKIGQLILDTGATSIERIALYGEDDNFRVDNNGSIYLADHAKLDFESKTRYDLGARALNSRGYGNEVHIVVNVNNIADELPTLGAFIGAIDENASAGTLIGNIQIGASSELVISSIVLTGEGSEDFVIYGNGSIRVSDLAQLDYENKKNYLLKAIASSDTGFVSEGEVIISLHNIPEFVPILKPLSTHVEVNATVGTIVGQVKEDVGGDTTVIGYELSGTGSENFVTDANGIIRISDQASFDSTQNTIYILHISAINLAGSSQVVEVRIEIIIPDITNPEITLRGNNTISVVQGTSYLDLGARAYDDRDGDISTGIVVDNPVDTNAPVGTTYIVSYDVSDLAGNKASTQTRSITIVRDLNINLTDWKANGTGKWVLQTDNRTILQTLNADPTMYHNNVDSQSDIFELTGAITVKTNSDDDFIGFVLGYKDGDLNRDSVDYLLIDWKQGDQSGGKKGLSISRITKKLTPGAWTHDASKGVTELQRGTSLGNVGWRDNTSYIFRITFTSTLVEVFINDVKELSITGEFSDGAYGFYNYSQGSVLYSAIRAEANTNTPPTANAGIDQNITVGTEVILDGIGSTDDIGIASYLWKEEDNVLSYDSRFSIDDLPLGLHTITLTVEDDEGESDADDVVVIVNEI